MNSRKVLLSFLPSEALVVALIDDKDHVVAEKNMECLANGRTRVKDRKIDFLKKKRDFSELNYNAR